MRPDPHEGVDEGRTVTVQRRSRTVCHLSRLRDVINSPRPSKPLFSTTGTGRRDRYRHWRTSVRSLLPGLRSETIGLQWKSEPRSFRTDFDSCICRFWFPPVSISVRIPEFQNFTLRTRLLWTFPGHFPLTRWLMSHESTIKHYGKIFLFILRNVFTEQNPDPFSCILYSDIVEYHGLFFLNEFFFYVITPIQVLIS